MPKAQDMIRLLGEGQEHRYLISAAFSSTKLHRSRRAQVASWYGTWYQAKNAVARASARVDVYFTP